MTPALIHELFLHQAWADGELLRAINSHNEASLDEKLIGAVHHIVVVQQAFTALVTGCELPKEFEPVKSLSAVQQLYAAGHTRLLGFVDGVSTETLERPVENPWMPELKATVGQTLLQVVLHSQGHRGQCLSRLRELTGGAPTLDFILWLKLGRPQPAFVAAAGE